MVLIETMMVTMEKWRDFNSSVLHDKGVLFTHEVSHDNSVKSLRIVFCSQYKLQTWSRTGCCGIRAVTCVDKRRRIGQGTLSYLRSQSASQTIMCT